MTGVGRLTADPEIRFSQSGVAVLTVPLAFNARRKDESGNWVDGDSFFVRGTLFREAAENGAESLSKGMEVVVTGRLKTDQWEDRETGQKRSAPALLIDSIGPNVRFVTVTVNKVERNGSGGSGGSAPWGSAPTPAGRGGWSDEPPF
ncbi:single-stranded DNA-binding protein [Saccharopolyspora taberi]